MKYIPLFAAILLAAVTGRAQERTVKPASQAETDAGIVTSKFVTPATLNAVVLGIRALPSLDSTPWATAGTLATDSIPWTVFKTVIATNDGLGISTNDYRAFPTAGYDAARGRIVAAYNTGYTHLQTNAQPEITTSYDGGRTWSLQSLTGVVPLGTQVALTVLRNGHYLMECTTRTFPAGVATYSPTFVLGSTDGLTWNTNGFISTGVNEKRQAPGSGLELANGNIIMGWIPTTNSFGTNGVSISSNEGATWTNVNVDTNGNECSLSLDSSGTIWFLSRRGLDYEIFNSTDNGLTWSDKGPSRIGSNLYASFPATFFLGNRMIICSRAQPYGEAVFYYCDVAPYTNGWATLYRNDSVSVYDAPVKLSPSVALVVSAFDTDPNAAAGNTTSNAWVESWVVANNGEGWKSLPSDFTSTPSVWLRNSDIPANGHMTVWPNYGSITISPTNSSVNGAYTYPYYGQNVSRLALCLGYTNVNFGVSNVLASIWTNGIATFIWRSARTNGGDNASVFDNCNFNQNFVGFQLKQNGANIYFSVSHGLGTTWAGRYVEPCTDDYTGTPHTYAAVVNGSTLRVFEDGHRISGAGAANSGTGAYSTADQSKFHLSIGTVGDSSSTTGPLFMGDAMIFTNVLSDGEIYAWENLIRHPNQ